MPWKWILILVVALAIGFGAVVYNPISNSGTKAESNTKIAN